MEEEQKKYQVLIIVASVLIPVAVALLLFMPEKLNMRGDWLQFLPRCVIPCFVYHLSRYIGIYNIW